MVDNEVVKNTKLNTLKAASNNLEKTNSWCNYFNTLIHINQYNTDKKKCKKVDKKIQDTSVLVTKIVFNEIEDKLPDTSRYKT